MLMMADIEDIESSVLLTTFTSKKKRYKVYFHQNQIIWDREKPPYGYTNRPKNLLLFVNPYGGKKNAMKIYEKIAKPLFLIAGIEVTVNVSQRKDQIRDFVMHHSLEMFDAIGCVGGDGTLSELFNGLVIRECNKQNTNFNDIDAKLPRPTLPIGVIPGGSTDAIAYCIHGTTDIATAVLHIVLGDRLGLDLVSVYDENKLLSFYASVFSYGFLGDVAHHSDKYRWLGPSRYEFSGFRNLLCNNGYQGEVAMLMDNNSGRLEKCYENCTQCLQKRDNYKCTDSKWRTLSGKYFMISGANISCACDRSPNGIAPYSHLGDGNVHMVLVRHTTLLNNIKLLMRLNSKRKFIYDLPFVEIYQAKEFCFRSFNEKSKWNCDGEVQMQTDIRAKVQCQLLSIFGRGTPQPVETSDSCCSCSFC